MTTEQDLLNEWKLGTVTRAIEYCQCCKQQTRCGLIQFDDGSLDTLHVQHMHRDGSSPDKFAIGARVAQKKDSHGLSAVSVLLRR